MSRVDWWKLYKTINFSRPCVIILWEKPKKLIIIYKMPQYLSLYWLSLQFFSVLQNVFLTGGCASFLNMQTRLERELLSIRPFQSKFKVITASNPVMDAWYGARKWARSSALSIYSITKADYEEKGAEYLKEHCASNRYFPSPAGQPSAS